MALHLKKQKGIYFNYVDFIRGVASISILFWHYQHFFVTGGEKMTDKTVQPFYQTFYVFYNYGASAVQLFWVLSGFVFASVYLLGHTPQASTFFVNRFARLYPLHLLTLLLIVLLQSLSICLTGGFQVYQLNDFYHFILNLFLISGWGLEKGYSFNGPIWSVSVEVLVYILFYCSIRQLKKAPFLLTAAFVLLFALATFLHFPGYFWICGYYFFIGTAVFIVLNLFQNNSKMLFTLSAAGLLTGLILGLIPKATNSQLQLSVLFPSIVLLAATFDLVDLKGYGKKIKGLGDLSYSLYLFHVPVQIAILIVFYMLGLNKSIFLNPFAFCGFVLLTFLISYLSYHYYEFPIRDYIRRKFKSF